MPQISQSKKEKISEQILYYLFSIAPESKFTSDIAAEIARDEAFTKHLLEQLKNRSLVVEITKNSNGRDYKRRQRWRLSNTTYNIYKQRQ